MEIQSNISLKQYNSWRVGGAADFFCKPQTVDEISFAQKWATEKSLPLTILSGGSNVLISDQGIRGLVIHLGGFTGVDNMQILSGTAVHDDGACEDKKSTLRVQTGIHIVAKSGTPKAEILKLFLRHQLDAALFLAGIPGDVGGGVVMNAGVGENIQPREFVEIVDWVEVLKPDEKIVQYKKVELNWSYRHCKGWEPGIIIRVGLTWLQGEPHPNILQKVRDANQLRLRKQPLEWPSCGSVFVNPVGHKAGVLIESSGLKGFRIGDAQVSEKHANFIVNLGSAKAQDIHAVIEHMQKTVQDKFQVKLITEVVFLGF